LRISLGRKIFFPEIFFITTLLAMADENLVKEATEAFAFFDKGSEGSIKTKDMQVALRSLGFSFSPAQLKEMERDADPATMGYVKQADFLRQLSKAAVFTQQAKQETRKALQEMAQGMARLFEHKQTSDGTVSSQVFRHALTRVGDRLSDDEFTEMCKTLKVDNGRIKLDVLSDFMTSY
jgi:calmodulin